MNKNTCYLCMRITSQDVFTAAHKLIQDKTKAHEMGAQASECLKKAYEKKPSLLCGRTSLSILGGLFYLLSLEFEEFLTTQVIELKLGISEVSVRTLYKIWLENFPDLFPNCSLKEIPYGGETIRKLHYKGKFYTGISWPGYYEGSDSS
jgi:hypothetical protein